MISPIKQVAIIIPIFIFTSAFVTAQRTVVLNPITINVDNDAYAKTQIQGQSEIKNITSTDSTVATAREWGTNEIQIHGKRPGTTTIRFFDNESKTNYQITVTVNPRPAPPRPPVGNNGNDGGNQDGGSMRPNEITDHAPFGNQLKQNFPNGGYKEVYKNKAGQVVEEKYYDKNGKVVKTTDVDKVYADGKAAQVTNTNAKGELEEITYDKTGKVIKTEVYKDLNEFGQATTKEVTENGVTKIYKRDKKTDKWVAQNNVPMPNPPAAAGKVDKRLVGAWVSKSIEMYGPFGPEADGGDNIMLIIGSDGSAKVIYDAMTPFKQASTNTTNEWSGIANGKITASNGKIAVESTTDSTIRNRIVYSDGRSQGGAQKNMGTIFGGDPKLQTYTVDGDTLIMSQFFAGTKTKVVTFTRMKE
jgi:hypothetical protein